MNTISLAGNWRVSGAGAAASLHLPGTLAAQGIGEPISLETKWVGSIFDPSYFTAPEYARWREAGNLKVPFFLQPERHFVGEACYEREFEIPAAWEGKRIVLALERVHWASRVSVDGREIGAGCDSLSTPHGYDFGTTLAVGQHTLRVWVDNRVQAQIGVNSHSITDHTQGNWNGVIGEITLTASALTWLDEVQVYPRVATRSVLVKGRVGGAIYEGLRVRVGEGQRVRSNDAAWHAVRLDGCFDCEIPLGPEAALWDEFSPALHSLTVALENGETCEVRFGLREISTRGTQFCVNGRAVFLRGTLECAVWPRTGHPPTDVDSWRTLLRAARAHGLNHLRFHSWCPPEAAFIAGDEAGFYFQIEAASWPNQGATVGDGRDADAWIVRESDRIVRAYGNHPSFMFFAAGNEPDGARSAGWLAYWTQRMKALGGGRQWHTCTAGWPEISENEFHINHAPRMHQWLDHLKSRINALPPETCTDYRDYIAARAVPVVSHEIGQWCAYPNFAEIPKYTGYLKPRNFEIFRETLAEHGMASQAADFVRASGMLQSLCYKEEIESALRTPGMGGFQLLGLSDFPGQGTALVGVLDAFWEEKAYITPSAFSRFCSVTVPLARLPKRVFECGEIFSAELEVAHFGARDLRDVAVRWRLEGGDAEGVIDVKEIPTGKLTRLGAVRVVLQAQIARKLRLIVSIGEHENDWDSWLYPKTPCASTELLVARVLDDTLLATLHAGGSAVLMIPPERVLPDAQRGKVQLGFSSIFWNTAWTNQQAPHTLGILCDPTHPALADFPTGFCSNWQWWYIVTDASAMILDAMPHALRPIVQVVDDWFTNRKLGLVFECRVGAGRLLICSVDLSDEQCAKNPVARQLRASLLRYAASENFKPPCVVSAETLREIFPHAT